MGLANGLRRIANVVRKATTTDVLNKEVERIVAVGTASNQDWSYSWRRGYNYALDNQLSDLHVPGNYPRVQLNHIFPANQTALAMTIMQEQGLTAIPANPADPKDAKGAEQWGPIMAWQYEEGVKMPSLRVTGKQDGQLTGNMAVEVYWEDRARWDEDEGWQGEVRRRLCRIDQLGFDPEWEDTETPQDCKWMWTRRYMPMDEATVRYPKFKDAIEQQAVAGPEKSTTILTSAGTREGDSYIGGVEGPGVTTEGTLVARLIQPPGRFNRDERHIEVLNVFMRDYTETKVTADEKVDLDVLVSSGQVSEYTDPETGVSGHVFKDGTPLNDETWPMHSVTRSTPKYPKGRHVVRLGVNIIAIDEPVGPKDEWDIVIGKHRLLPHTARGLNATLMDEATQDYCNIAAMQFAGHLANCAQPWLVVEEGCMAKDPDGKNPAKWLSADNGKILVTKTGKLDRIKFLVPPPVSDATMKGMEIFKEQGADTLGSQDIMRGKAAGSRATASEVIRLEANSRMAVAMENKYLDDWTRRVMQTVYAKLATHLQVGDVMRMAGIEKTEAATVTQEMLDANVQITLKLMSVMPGDAERDKQEAQYLFKVLGPAYVVPLLKAFKVPNANSVGKGWVQQQLAAQQQAQQQEAREQGTPGMGTPPPLQDATGVGSGGAAGMSQSPVAPTYPETQSNAIGGG